MLEFKIIQELKPNEELCEGGYFYEMWSLCKS